MPDLQNKAKILLSYFRVYFFNKKNNKIKSGIVVDAGSTSIQETDGRIGNRQPMRAQQHVSGQEELCSKTLSKEEERQWEGWGGLRINSVVHLSTVKTKGEKSSRESFITVRHLAFDTENSLQRLLEGNSSLK